MLSGIPQVAQIGPSLVAKNGTPFCLFTTASRNRFFLKDSVKIGIILHGSQNCAGIQIVLPELYNTVEVKNYAE